MESLAHLGDIEFDTDIEPCDVSLSGKLLAAVPANISTDRLEILRFGGKSVSPYRRWINKNPADSNQDVDQLLFVGDDKVLTISTSTRSATVWDIDKAQALWTIKFDSTTMPVLSPGEKQLAVMGTGGIGILDTASGNTLARIEGFNAHGGILAYSPDGRRLGCLTGGQLQVWDLTTGKLTHEMWFKHLLVQQLDFLKNNYVLINRQYVVDLDKRIFLWQYDLPAGASKPQTVQVAGGRLWAPFGGFGKPHAVGSVSLPDAAARDMAASLTVEKVTAFQPGAKACVKCEVPGASAEELKHVTKVLTDQLTEAGIVVVAEAPLVVLASLADSGTSTANYRIVGGQKEQASVVQQTGTISIKENGKVLWAQSLSTTPRVSSGGPGINRCRKRSIGNKRKTPPKYSTGLHCPLIWPGIPKGVFTANRS